MMAKRPKFVFARQASSSPATATAQTTAVPTPIFTAAQTPPTTTSVPAAMPTGVVGEQLNYLNMLVVKLLAQNQEMAERSKVQDEQMERMAKKLDVQGQLITASLTKNQEQDDEIKQLTLVSEKHTRHIARLRKKNRKLKLTLKSQTLLLKGAGDGGDDDDDEERSAGSENEPEESAERLERRSKRRSDRPASPPQSPHTQEEG